ncbi:MAG TPA: TIR domain-containing protein [Steroidobacteraceae bacterium]|nr:TIR domain-containing protein [Steroidobacteraceae bacterium]
MATDNPETPATPRPTVFLSYASEDRRAAQRLRDALPAFGMEVWYDESDLVGGDAWDQKIRRQIRECDYFMPVISAHTEARHEGYFRREWRLAVERTLDMADDHVFLLPVVIDNTAEGGARVPDKFRAVQWLRVPDGQSNPALEALCRRLVSGEPATSQSGERPRPTRSPGAGPSAPLPAGPPGPGPGKGNGSGNAGGAAASEFPPFPREEPGQKVRFWFQIAGWALLSAWAAFQRLPRWLRIIAYAWIGILLLSRGCSQSYDRPDVPDRVAATPRISATQEQKLKDLAQSHPGNWTAADTENLITQIAKQIPAAARDEPSASAPLLAIPFAAPAGDGAAQKFASSVFTQVYGRLAIARHGRVALADQPLSTLNATAAAALGSAHDSSYVVYGAVAGSGPGQQLSVRIVTTDDGSLSWSKSYPVTGTDPAAIAAEVAAHIPNDDD